MATNKPSTTENPTPKLNRREIKPEPLSLELFNRAASDLDDKGETFFMKTLMEKANMLKNISKT